MRRSFSMALAAVGLAGGVALGTAVPSQAATVTVTSSCKYDTISTSGTQTAAKNTTCINIQSFISYADGNTVYTAHGDKAGKGLVSLANAATSMTTAHYITAWLPDGGTVTSHF